VRVCDCLFRLVPGTCASPSFYRPKEGGHTCEISTGLSTSPRIGGELLVVLVAECSGAWRRVWSSSLRILRLCPGRVRVLWRQSTAWRWLLNVQCPASDEVGHRGCCGHRSCPSQGPYRVQGSSPMPAEGPAGGKVQRVGGTVARRCQASPHRAPQSCTAPGIAAQGPEQADGTPVTSAVWRGDRRRLTPPDSI
jgi:hypothetical protein